MKNEAQKKFEENKKKALQILKDLTNDLENYNPEKINWGNVGSMSHFLGLITEAKNFGF